MHTNFLKGGYLEHSYNGLYLQLPDKEMPTCRSCPSLSCHPESCVVLQQRNGKAELQFLV